MSILQGVILAALALGLGAVVWGLRCALLKRTIGGRKTKITVVVTSQGSAAELEQSVNGLLGLVEDGALAPDASIVIKDGGMGAEAAQMAAILARENPSVILG